MPPHPYRRDLPHVFPPGVPIFLTWRLHGSLPARGSRSTDAKRISAGERFRDFDRLQDRAASGPLWLRVPEVAIVVCEQIESAASYKDQFVLHEFVAMPNHVHMLIFPKADVAQIMHHLKLRTAQKANRILNRLGHSFWQSESFDHWCRSVAEMAKIRQYIVMNPVKAGLVRKPQSWPWCSYSRNLARKRGELPPMISSRTCETESHTEHFAMPHKSP